MTFTRGERFLLLGIVYVIVIAVVVAIWPTGGQTSVSRVRAGGWLWPTATSTPSAKPTPTMAPKPQTYTVVVGDSPQVVADKTSYPWLAIYERNGQLIENDAKAHGLLSSQNGMYLYPGEVLTLPSGH